ncbi:hypothetical protein BDA99DRAFT_558116 [Phascolomyces articulosus]|uniref:BHLH domain-containing protein n=1 Tax=Phascolomyces articulosus TaxID=60185 RepID=A0AAD5KCN7_9FUNG|nr:hypothetical protein BDA99DRAFT_558116 [Phascolomyces articulosus]
MEAFGIYDDDDPTLFTNANYPTLSQFDLDLQQQAQAALQQGGWQDFDMFLPQVVPEVFYSNNNNNNTLNNHNNNGPITPPTTSTQQQQPLSQQTTQDASINIPPPFIDSNALYNTALFGNAMSNKMINNNNSSTMPISPPLVSFDATPIVPSQWTTTAAIEPVENNLKTEYPSPENVACSPTSESKSQFDKVNFIDSLPPMAAMAPSPPLLTSTTTSSPSNTSIHTSTDSITTTTITSPPSTNTSVTDQQQQLQTTSSLPPQQQQTIVTSQPVSTIATPPSAADASPPPAAATAPASPWNNSGFPEPQGNKVPIQRLKPPATSVSAQQTNGGLVPTNGLIGGRQQKKTAHNAIERRYRNNINDRIAELKNAVPALLHAKLKDTHRTGKRSRTNNALDDDDDEGEDGEEYLDGVAVATKLNKATILRKATEYITHLKKTGDDMRQENAVLQHLLAQLPGGQEVLGRYQMQKVQRDQEMQRQRLLERQQLAKQQQQQRKPGRKRTKTTVSSSSPLEEYESASSTGSDPATPPPAGNRVFMAIFACLTFFSSSPLTAGPSSTEQFQNHHHASRAATVGDTVADSNYTAPPPSSTTTSSFISSLLPLDNTWTLLRTLVFVLFIGHLLFPYMRSVVFGRFSLNVKRVPRAKRVATRKRIQISNAAVSSAIGSITPGDQKCFRIYDILVRSLEMNEDGPPRTSIGYLLQTTKEAARLISRQAFGYEILYDEDDQLVLEDEWEQVCNWIKLNEIECLGGNPEITRWTMLHSCLRMINLVEVLDDEEHEFLPQMRARVYATAAIEMAALLRHFPLANRLSRYFWRQAVYETSEELRHPKSGGSSDDGGHMRSLVSMIQQQDQNIEDILQSQSWDETLQVIRYQVGQSPTDLSLSLTAPVLVPVAILSTLHLLDSLQTQFGRLIGDICNTSPLGSSHHPKNVMEEDDTSSSSSSSTSTDQEGSYLFESILSVTRAEDDHQRLAYWLAAVGMTVETLWKNDIKAAEHWMGTVVQRIPRALMVNHGHGQDIVAYKNKMNALDEQVKKHLVHVLSGATLIKRGEQTAGMEQLRMAEQSQHMIKKFKANNKTTTQTTHHLESVVMALADFAVSVIGLEAWISAWKQPHEHENNRREIREQVAFSTNYLRRMIKWPLLKDLQTNQMIDRLSRLSRFVAQQPDETDSACDCSDIESDDDHFHGTATLLYDTDMEEDEMLAKRADKAHDILHGIV